MEDKYCKHSYLNPTLVKDCKLAPVHAEKYKCDICAYSINYTPKRKTHSE